MPGWSHPPGRAAKDARTGLRGPRKLVRSIAARGLWRKRSTRTAAETTTVAKVYFDSGALVKLYIVEPGSTFVQNKARRAEVIPINPLQETELRNAILAAGGRRSIAREAMRRSLDNFEEDLATGVFIRETPEWPWIYRRADLLARQYTPRFLCRTLDILHVAAAELCGADQIVTGDQRQQKLAKAIGMAVVKVPTAGR